MHRPLHAAFAAQKGPGEMADKLSGLRARRMLCEGKQRSDAVVEDAVVCDRRHEAVSPRWRTILEIAQALVVTPERHAEVPRRPRSSHRTG
jgi:hypothetical protein